MALPIGKLTILVGAGLVGSVLAKEGRLSNVSDFFSGAFKIVVKQIKRADSTPSVSKPHNDSLLAQVNSLRHELQLLASNRPITIVTASGTGGGKYGIIIIAVVVGYGYIWWKGWKLPDMMFATRRSLSEARSSISKQLENVYSSIAATKRHLSSRIDRVDKSLDECMELTTDTQERVSELRGKTDTFGSDIRSVHHAVRTLENKIWSFGEKQDLTTEGVRRLCGYAWSLENDRSTASLSGSYRPSIESSMATPSSSSRKALGPPPASPSRNGSLAPVFPAELSPSGSNGSVQVQQPLQSAVSTPGLMVHGISEACEASSSRDIPNVARAPETTKNRAASPGLFGLRVSGIGVSFITRTRSATNALLQQTRSNGPQS